MESCTAQRDGFINWQNAIREPGADMIVDPAPQDAGLRGVFASDLQRAALDFEE
ncbi:MAG TPA: hypothetical protein VG819_01680 [Rhizomicrobium sp.]|nr:hypothetical protein [Rhizomicrobium sp.]